VSTLKAIFEGRRDLFEGLWIGDSNYDWTPYPVIHLSMNRLDIENDKTLTNSLCRILKSIALSEDLKITDISPVDLFNSLIEKLYKKYDKKGVVVLIDEYDTPILDHITSPEVAKAIRKKLKNFYGVLKGCEDYLRFTFITGVTKFTKTSLFSELNNLDDISLDKKFANICGFTHQEFDSLFKDYMDAGLGEFKTRGIYTQDKTTKDLRQEILDRYDGYSWDGETRVLNPWSVLNFFSEFELADYWFDSGTPTFLVNLIKECQMEFNFFKNNSQITALMNKVDVGQFEPTALMFQTGYLTVDKVEYESSNKIFHLRFPNLEVKAALAPLLLSIKEPFKSPLDVQKQATSMLDYLVNRDAKGFESAFGSFLANIPYSMHLQYDAYYQTVLVLGLVMAGQGFEADGQVGDGRFDIHFRAATGDDYIIELKHDPFVTANQKSMTEERINKRLDKLAKQAMTQIEKKKYTKKFQGLNNKIFKTALVIDGYTNVKVVFEEAANWVMGKSKDGIGYTVLRTQTASTVRQKK
jgi:hypothetical protein